MSKVETCTLTYNDIKNIMKACIYTGQLNPNANIDDVLNMLLRALVKLNDN